MPDQGPDWIQMDPAAFRKMLDGLRELARKMNEKEEGFGKQAEVESAGPSDETSNSNLQGHPGKA